MSLRVDAVGLWLAALVASVASAGCTGSGRQAESPGPGAATPISNTDPCAMRLHDLSGALLGHYARFYEFPDDLAALSSESALLPAPPVVCPVSEQPYVYNPGGIFLPERDSRILLYDPAPSHSGIRWAITVEEPADGGLPITKVIALPESFFLLRPPE